MYSLFTTKPTKPTKCFHGSACLTASKVHPVSPLLAHDLYILHEIGWAHRMEMLVVWRGGICSIMYTVF